MDLIRQRMAERCKLPESEDALPGRSESMPVGERHAVLNTALKPPYPNDVVLIYFGMGCFWGAERKFWNIDGVFTTAVGYMGGYTPNPLYEEVCSGQTGHNEVVLVAYHPQQVSLDTLLSVFWQSHDPTQGMRQGNDVGTQYRSGIYYSAEEQLSIINSTRDSYQQALRSQGYGEITSEIAEAENFYFAEDYHQQYLFKNPNGYCGLGGTGVSCEF